MAHGAASRTTFSSKTRFLNTRRKQPKTSSWTTRNHSAALAEDKYKQNLRKLEIVPSIRRYGGERRLTALIPFGQVLGRARHFGGRHAFNGSNKAEIECRLQAMAANWAALRGFWFARSPWSHLCLESEVRRLRVSTHTQPHLDK